MKNLLLFFGVLNDYWRNRFNERNLNLFIDSTNKIYVNHIIATILIFIKINIKIFLRKNFQFLKEKNDLLKEKKRFIKEKNQYFDKLPVKYYCSDF